MADGGGRHGSRGGGGGDFADDYEAVFEMMKMHCAPLPPAAARHPPPSPATAAASAAAACSAPAAKRPRLSAEGEEEPTPMAVPSGPVASSCSSSLVARPTAPQGAEAPPERVALAYARLELPLNASGADIERQGRQLARRAHPDKVAPDFPELRRKAEDQFRELQEAKAVALAWLRGRVSGKDFEVGSLDSESDLGEDSDVSSDDRDERMDLKACGLPSRHGEWEEPESPRRGGESDGGGSGEDSDAERAAGRAAGPSGLRVADTTRGAIPTSDNVVEQAAALSGHLEAARAGAAGRRKPTCSECFEREAIPDDADGVCRSCRRDLDRLWRSLGRRGAQ